MKKALLVLLGITLIASYAWAIDLEYFQTYTPKEGMSADEIMQIDCFNKYTLFAHDVAYIGKAYFIDKGSVRERSTARKRLNLGRKSDGVAYKDITVMTGPMQFKGIGILSWTYMNPAKEQDAWIWLPTLKKVRKISASEGDDSFLGSDFSVEDISTRRFEDETYKLIKEDNFSGYTSDFLKKSYYQGTPCYVIEATPKRAKWYYAKRIIWVDKQYGTNIYEEKYDAKGNKFQYMFRWYQIFKVDGKEYPMQMVIEGEDLRKGHRTVITNDTVDIDKGISEEQFTERMLGTSRW